MVAPSSSSMAHEYGACSADVPRAPTARAALLAVGLAVVAVATLALAADANTWTSVVSLDAAPAKSEKGLVKSAMAATKHFADHDVSAAVLRAQLQAKQQYQQMMASALKVEAKAHKEGQVATERALSWQARREQRRIMHRRLRNMRDEKMQAIQDAKERNRMVKELDRSLGTRVIEGN